MPPRWARSVDAAGHSTHSNPAATMTNRAAVDALACTKVILQRQADLVARGLRSPRYSKAKRYCDQGTVITNFSLERPVAVTAISFGRTTRRLNGVPSRPLNSP